MRKISPKTLLGLASLLLPLSSCQSQIDSLESNIEDSSSSKSDESSEAKKSSSQAAPSSETSSSTDDIETKTATISFGDLADNISTSPSEKSYELDGISLKSFYFTNCFGANRKDGDSNSNALKMGSGKKIGSFDISFENAIIVKRVNIYATKYSGDTSVEYNLSSSANPTGMDITIDKEESSKYSYIYLDNERDEKSTSISFKANAKGRIYVHKIEISYSSNGSSSSSSSSKETSSSSSEESSSSIIDEQNTSSSCESSDSVEPSIDESGYYKGVDWNATGATLKTSLFNVISKDTKSIGYDGLWSAYEKTDLTDEGYIWDMYSNETFNPKNDRAGSYKSEGDCYNREHSIPQSKFAGTDSAKMKSDIFHVYPTDGYVNNRRSNYPHGNVSNATYTSKNGSKLGTGNNNGYNGTVFEPIDEYKGDFARTYFYFVTRYQSSIPSMGYDSFSKNTYPSLSSWAIKTYLAWNDLDPVSEKEIKRNDAAYLLQNNRNPFIDHPEAVHKIWDGANN